MIGIPVGSVKHPFGCELMQVRARAGVDLMVRCAGEPEAPTILFLHGFPEAAFVWDDMLAHFAGGYRCLAPNLRGYSHSFSPAEASSYRVKELLADLVELLEAVGHDRVEAVVAHDWGGALAWSLAAMRPDLLKRLVIINAPHPGTFLRALQSDPEQQAASAYMNFLSRDDAETLLAENDFARMWPFFTNMGAADASMPGGGWLTDEVREQYRAVWRAGLRGPLNYYRASPLRPPTANDDAVMRVTLPDAAVTVRVPTTVIWAEDDIALRPSLLEGLDRWVPDLNIVRVPGATHWIVHERPDFIAAEIERALAR